MRGIILAGGNGTRLYPTTLSMNKHLFPVYDKPMIYYPLTTLILAGVKDITIVSTESGINQFEKLLGDGNQLGIEIDYKIQSTPGGIVDGLRIGLDGKISIDSTLLILGDNVFFGEGLGRKIGELDFGDNCYVWTQEVENPNEFGVAVMDGAGNIQKLEEKPQSFVSNTAVTGMYFFPRDVTDKCKGQIASARGELEVVGLLNTYLEDSRLKSIALSRGAFWADAGTSVSLSEISQFIHLIQTRQGNLVGSPEEASRRVGNINQFQFKTLLDKMPESAYKNHLSTFNQVN
jgi:glucose-1-phosphate thymidylyltransferase